jgi:hypothetical protein
LVGALCFSGKCRAVICEAMTFAHLVDALDGVLRRLDGTPRGWRTDRMATVVHPGTDRITARFAQAAKHSGADKPVAPRWSRLVASRLRHRRRYCAAVRSKLRLRGEEEVHVRAVAPRGPGSRRAWSGLCVTEAGGSVAVSVLPRLRHPH